MNKRNSARHGLAALSGAVALTLGAGAAQAGPSVEAGDWTLSFDGNVNGYFTSTSCEDNPQAVLSGLACTDPAPATPASSDSQANVRTGLLPAKLGFEASTTKGGWDTTAYVSFWPGVDDSAGGRGLGANSANFRQVYLSFGNDNVGTFKIGRDLGIFGSDAILSDITLLGVGGVSNITLQGGRTSLGGIGTGYVYADWKAQVQYQTPDFGGLQFTVAAVDPWDPINLSGASAGRVLGSTARGKQEGPGFEGKANYSFDTGTLNGKLWASVISQKVEFGTLVDDTASGFDVGAQVNFGGLGLTGYYYTGDGLGTTAFLFDAFDAAGNARDSDGFLAQATYKLPGPGTKLGVAFGQSNLDRNSIDPLTLVETNERWTAGAYHPLTEDLNLVAEYTQVTAEAHNGNENEESTLALGAIIFF